MSRGRAGNTVIPYGKWRPWFPRRAIHTFNLFNLFYFGIVCFSFVCIVLSLYLFLDLRINLSSELLLFLSRFVVCFDGICSSVVSCVLQMHRRKTQTRLPIQGNFYPMTTAAFIEDTSSRMTLLSAQSHGVAAFLQGAEFCYGQRVLQITHTHTHTVLVAIFQVNLG